MSKHDRIKQSHASKPPPERQGWTAGSGGNRGGLAWWGAGLAIAVAAAVVLVVAAGKSEKSEPAGVRVSSGPAPAFSERDVSSGAPVTSDDLRGESVLLFFNEGVMCQACFEQIQVLQQRSGELRKHGLTLVNITTDPPDVLREAVQAYGIETPTVSDQSKDMSTAYGAIGQGMHPDTNGHTFVLIDGDGRIRWRRDYTTMFVPPDRLFADIPKVH
jgi:peroxiredoxin Q/BCP